MFKIFKIIKISTLVMVGVGIATIAEVRDAGSARADSTTMPEIGAFEALSSGNKKIAEALFNGQIVTADGSAPLSLDLIAASKQRNGWGRIFKQLKADGLIDARNLGELASGRYQRRTAVKSLRPAGSAGVTVVTTASGRQIIIDKKSHVLRASRNRGRSINRRGSRNIHKHADGLFGSGSTYRGRLTGSGQSRSAASLGITSGNGVGTTTIITDKP